MTEAGWTREKPTVAGWYWWRSLNGMIGPEIIQIDNTNGPDTDLEVIGPFGETPLDEWIAESGDEPGEWQGPLSPDSYQQGRVAVNVDALVDRFLAWPLPASVCSDLCATKQGSPHRSGTNLLSAVEAKAMIEHVLGIAQQAPRRRIVRNAGTTKPPAPHRSRRGSDG